MKKNPYFSRILLAAVVGIGAVFFTTPAAASAAELGILGVTEITAVKTFASADNTFENGWKWIFDVTLPENEVVVRMQFADWISGTHTIPATGNIRFYSAQSSNAPDAERALLIRTAGTYSDPANITAAADLDPSRAGIQIQIAVEARVPAGSAGGSYGTSYGIRSLSALVSAVASAHSLHDSAREGTRHGEYAAGSKAVLYGVIQNAEMVRDNPTATAEVVTVAGAALEQAIAAFQAGKVEETVPTLLVYTLSNTIISPNGDGIKDTVTVDVKFSEEVAAEIVIRSASGEPVRTLYRSGAVTNPHKQTWDGRDDGGEMVPDGIYTIAISASDAADNRMANTEKRIIKVTIDKIALTRLVVSAGALHDAAVEGDAVGQHPVGSKAALLSAISNAEATLDNTSATQLEINGALTDLENAVAEFEASQIAN